MEVQALFSSASQKINHFNGMLELCRKRNMARNLQKIQKMFPEHYDFFPKTFTLPTDLQVSSTTS
jgi:tubulin polyglutamylase TTLL6/13